MDERGGRGRRRIAARLLLIGWLAAPQAGAALDLVETPALAAAVAAGRLPGIAERVPAMPLVVELAEPWVAPGRPGGTLRMLTRSREPQAIADLGYARLVAYDPTLALVPDLLQSVTVEEGRSFTLRLRPGHKWSDGRAFTAEDFRYWWEDVASNPALSPTGPPRAMLVEGEPPRFTIIDAATVRYAWSSPNPEFLPALAAGQPLVIYRPSHYLRAFHVRHAERGALEDAVAGAGATDWAALHNQRDTTATGANPDLPVLSPWINTTPGPTERWLATRNPFYHRVDRQGRQLPYLDRIALARIAGERLVPAVTAGAADLQAEGLDPEALPALRTAAAAGRIELRLWTSGRGSALALHPNLDTRDPALRALNRDVRFRRALSLGIDRDDLARRTVEGRATGGGNALLPASPLYRPADRAAPYDPAEANRLLDALGLAGRAPDGTRRLADGRPLVIPTAHEDGDALATRLLPLLHDQLAAIGVRLALLPLPGELLRRRIASGEIVMSAGPGLANGLATADSSPAEWVPSDARQRAWPQWGRFVESRGKVGEPPTDAHALRLIDLYRQWRAVGATDRKAAVWAEITTEAAEALFSIGLVAGLPQPVVAGRALRNLPVAAIALPDPGLLLGLYRPDQLWLDE